MVGSHIIINININLDICFLSLFGLAQSGLLYQLYFLQTEGAAF